MHILTRESLLARRPRLERVEIDGQAVGVRTLTARELHEVREAARKTGNFGARLLVACLVRYPGENESWEPLLTPDDVKTLGEIDAGTFERLLAVALDVNGFTEKEEETARPTSSGNSGA